MPFYKKKIIKLLSFIMKKIVHSLEPLVKYRTVGTRENGCLRQKHI